MTTKSLDRPDGRSVRLAGRNKARVNDSSVEQDRACPALAFAATFLRARQTEVLSQYVKETTHSGRV
jgi:hypothetical protein